MKINRRELLTSLVLVFLSGIATKGSAAPRPAPENEFDAARLQAQIERIAQSVGGTVGVGIRHLETGHEMYVNQRDHFPMASLFKLTVAVQLLTLVEQNAVSLDKIIVVGAPDLRPGSSKLATHFRGPQSLSVLQLLEAMLIDSDNTATDILWKEAGGAKAIKARLVRHGITGLSVDRPTATLIPVAQGIGEFAADTEMTPARLKALRSQVPREQRNSGIATFLNDKRDTTTPVAIVELLSKIWRSEALGAKQTALMLDIMYRCSTGKARLRAGLPRATTVAHKTGTLQPSVTNDAGIIRLPGRGGNLIVVVLIKGSTKALVDQERAIADIARVIYDHFVSIKGRAN